MKRLIVYLTFAGLSNPIISPVSCFQSQYCIRRSGEVSRRGDKSLISLSLLEYENIAQVSERDEEEILEQLGYIPSNLVSIAARRGGDLKTPLVLKTYPLNGGASRRKRKAEAEGTPFPTLFWFCCKDVGKAIADLERRGFVKKLEERLLEPGMLQKFVKSHDNYAKERWDSLSYEHQQYVTRNGGMVQILRNSGIAGTDYESFLASKNPSIKCLHAHFAHYRAQIEQYSTKEGTNGKEDKKIDDIEGINIVGLWVDDLLRTEYPDLIL